MSVDLLDDVAAAIWAASSAFGLAKTWGEESGPVRQGFESQARAALAVIERPRVIVIRAGFVVSAAGVVVERNTNHEIGGQGNP